VRLLKLFVVTVITGSLIICAFLWALAQQGASDEELAAAFPGKLNIDEFGVPTIRASDQLEATKIQGYVVASQRLWQMDLFRRATVGRLSEVFGDAAAEKDISRRQLGVTKVLMTAEDALSQSQRASCQAYSDGVNQFINGQKWRWGIEFILLRYQPEEWTCKDSLSVLMMMSEDLTGAAARERGRGEWTKILPDDWTKFIFTSGHAWNKPLFGNVETPMVEIPDRKNWLPKMDDIRSVEVKGMYSSSFPPGSNSWVYRGKAGVFVANDPHLPHRVPQIWYALRVFYPATGNWQVGVTIPGIPGVVIGMNESLAWGITNTGEDVDDAVILRMNSDRSNYAASNDLNDPQWHPIERSEEVVKVKGQEPRSVRVIGTKFGPVIEQNFGEENLALSRHWLGLEPGILQLPAAELNSARDWDSFNQAVDDFSIPSQNLVYADRKGNIGYRVSGRGIIRNKSARIPVPAGDPSWNGIAQPTERRRIFISEHEQAESASIATANQRIWIDGLEHDWSSDDRANRIREVLAQRSDLSIKDMQALQHDTFSRMSLMLLNWIVRNLRQPPAEFDEYRARWAEWSGKIEEDPTSFAEAAFLEARLTNLMLSLIKRSFAPDKDLPNYVHLNRRGWVLELLNNDDAVRAFGLEPDQLAIYLVEELMTHPETVMLDNYAEMNRWRTQHPLAAKIPIVGRLFRIDEIPQLGSTHTVKVESPEMGASGRWVWSLTDPLRSVWSFPVGQSGHVASRHYRSFRKKWRSAEYIPVFPEKHQPPGLAQ
jgi:penicillin amidase